MAKTPTRPTISASIGFGLVRVACKAYTATEDHDMRFNSYHVHDDGSAARIEAPYICSDCGESVRGHTTKGFQREKDGPVILVTAEDFDRVDDEVGSDFEVTEFVHEDELSPMMLEQPYWLTPDPDPKKGKQNLEAYAVLRAALVEKRQVGIVKYSRSSKTHLAALRVVDNVLVIQNLKWPDEVRDHEFSVMERVDAIEINPKLAKAAGQIIESMSGSFDAGNYVDEAQEQLRELVEAKADGVELAPREEKEAEVEVGDLLAKLEMSAAKAEAKALERSKTRHPAGKRRTAKTAKSA